MTGQTFNKRLVVSVSFTAGEGAIGSFDNLTTLALSGGDRYANPVAILNPIADAHQPQSESAP